jgi:hypothetical protein
MPVRGLDFDLHLFRSYYQSMFSPRVPVDRTPNRVTRAVAEARTRGRALVDLTLTNPTRAGFDYPTSLLRPLASASGLIYEPQPFGLREARHAVARDYLRRGIGVASDRVILAASTSEAYSLLFKLLCRPAGDAVLVPTPSYPLFDHLARLDGVQPVAYRLEYHGRWTLDAGSVDTSWSDSIRAVIAVSPNNPTGSVLTVSEFGELAGRCAERNAALILDEVFADYPLHGSSAVDSWHTSMDPACLTFRLGGLSKSAGLPQVKLAWMAVSGPGRLVGEALDRLELICDTYLSVSTPVQVALPDLLVSASMIRRQIAERVNANHETLQALAASNPKVEILHADGGWSAVMRVPAVRFEEEVVLHLIERASVLVHPGFFFDFPHEAFLIVSLLPEPAAFAEGVCRVMERVSE